MVESLFQASMWLSRVTDDFKNSVVALRGTKGMKFQGFVQPGDLLVVSSQMKAREGSLTTFRVSGKVNDVRAVSGFLTVDSYNLHERDMGTIETDDYMRHEFRLTYKLLCNQLETEKTAGAATSGT